MTVVVGDGRWASARAQRVTPAADRQEEIAKNAKISPISAAKYENFAVCSLRRAEFAQIPNK
jgi:hypothetical protein